MLLSLEAIQRTYKMPAGDLCVLDRVDFQMDRGESVALVAPSGAGKSTVLHIAGLLEKPDGGTLSIAGQNCSRLSDFKRTKLRESHIGFVYQFHHLLPEFSALENVMLARMAAGTKKAKARSEALELLNQVGLGHRLDHRPARLSGGEQQRTAIARAIANRPDILLADEPTGNLDPATAENVFALLMSLVKERQMGVIIATHNTGLAKKMDRQITIHEGKLIPKPPR